MPSAQPCCPSLPSCPCPTGATHGIIPEFHSHFSPGFAQDFLPPSLLCSCSALRGKGSQMCWGGSRQSPEFHPVPCADSLYILFEGEKKNPRSPCGKAGDQARPWQLRHRGATRSCKPPAHRMGQLRPISITQQVPKASPGDGSR